MNAELIHGHFCNMSSLSARIKAVIINPGVPHFNSLYIAIQTVSVCVICLILDKASYRSLSRLLM